MTQLISWNIQCGRGIDDRIDLTRIADVVKGMADADIICMQEVSRFNPDLDNGAGADQVADLADHFSGYYAVFGPALDRPNGDFARPRQFGNLILSRLPVLQIFRHQLPQPSTELPCKNMPRLALEVVVLSSVGLLRITTTHLEFHSEVQRLAQVQRLCELQAEAQENLNYYDHAPVSGPYAAIPRPVQGIICGDFNSLADDAVYQSLTSPVGVPGVRFHDAWRLIHNDKVHIPTCGVFDHQQWPGGSDCRDFFFMSDAAQDLALNMSVNVRTDASDHQPILLQINK